MNQDVALWTVQSRWPSAIARVSKQPLRAHEVRPVANRMTLYASQSDDALILSKYVHGGTRAGGNALFLEELVHPLLHQREAVVRTTAAPNAEVHHPGPLASALADLDRVLHRAITINIRGHSYRLKEKLKAGLVRMEETAATT